MVEIISQGILPVEDMFKGTCGNCKTVFKFKRGEAKYCPAIDQKYRPYFSIHCPLDGCNQTIMVAIDNKETTGLMTKP